MSNEINNDVVDVAKLYAKAVALGASDIEVNKVKDLLPCPFCGSKYVQMRQIAGINYYVRCGDCFGASAKFNHPRRATVAWNMRS